jgi:aminoglycoside phosphotransferase (APT) family kinase protein
MNLQSTAEPVMGALRKRLGRWLQQTLAVSDIEVGELRRASNGFSAETLIAPWSLSTAGTGGEIVVRFETPGGAIFLDTDIVAQADTLRALLRNGIAVPELIGVEADSAVLGRRFLVMKYSQGRPFPQNPSYNHGGWVKDLSPPQRAVLWTNALTVLGRTNRLRTMDGFSFLDRPQYGRPGLDQYLGWLNAWRHAALHGRAHPVIDHAMRYLDSNRPDPSPIAFVWGDSNPCNILFNADLSVSALLDFEAAALGPAELDLGWWFFLDRARLAGKPALEGVPDRDRCIALYEGALGRRVCAMDYFEILGGVRMALVIVRTVERLIGAGRLSSQTDAAFRNPMVANLAGLLGIDCGGGGDGFREFVAAVTAHASAPLHDGDMI